ncbi:hypothetical protein EDD70_2959 [Hydrogenoanaerobacterium saccharovorans]|uniref:Uncharacterized protein n=1 Tax=Hydrogenoanaerobacterium saccharovorans TaxID=474960 RepID=A0A1H7YH45_9FIRM|nr:hypothetical protein [Hydrogenoanaerobacterium saccharovorans]RPF41899.1 hypothetical protein EDD70_2959 [Hydrogenoanaerobacterium saccharovorans]SEM45430.1 hypothetical protein SAMN05216180_0042 [Hydrogenoanaerobacterium saccharovorans]
MDVKNLEGNYTAIVAAVTCSNGKGKAEGYTVLELLLVVISGEQQGAQIRKPYFLKETVPESLTKDFYKLGVRVSTKDDAIKAKDDIAGKILQVSLSNVDSTVYCAFEQYIGTDDPAKYYSKTIH